MAKLTTAQMIELALVDEFVAQGICLKQPVVLLSKCLQILVSFEFAINYQQALYGLHGMRASCQ